MDDTPKLPQKYKIIFVIMAGILVLSLGLGIVGPLVYDAFDGGDDGGGNSIEIDASVGDSFRSTAEANPTDVDAVAAYANYLANTGELADAIIWYEKAISLAPEHPILRLDFARSLSSGAMHGDAELQFQKAIELSPENPEAHYYLAELYYGMTPQRTVDAIDEYERTIELAPESFIAQRAQERLVELGVATPAASPSPVA
jgi:tetratricopeptide (TPR) repeat protein